MSILRINIVFFGPNMASSQLPLIFWILKGWYLQNKKVLEAPILTGLYWDYIYIYICSICNVNWHIYLKFGQKALMFCRGCLLALLLIYIYIEKKCSFFGIIIERHILVIIGLVGTTKSSRKGPESLYSHKCFGEFVMFSVLFTHKLSYINFGVKNVVDFYLCFMREKKPSLSILYTLTFLNRQ